MMMSLLTRSADADTPKYDVRRLRENHRPGLAVVIGDDDDGVRFLNAVGPIVEGLLIHVSQIKVSHTSGPVANEKAS
jgi:hypothetical protein